MKTSVFCIVALVAFINSIDGIHAQAVPSKSLLRKRSIEDLQICTPGETKKEDCNDCFCIRDGSGWACTKRGCDETVTVNVDAPSQPRLSPLRKRSVETVQICTPGETKKKDCNNCFCTNDGTRWACTRKGCGTAVLLNKYGTNEQPNQNNLLKRALRDAPYSCVPNSRFKMDCNWCTCTQDGSTAYCTLMGCISDTVHLYPQN